MTHLRDRPVRQKITFIIMLIAGALKSIYDIGLYIRFHGVAVGDCAPEKAEVQHA